MPGPTKYLSLDPATGDHKETLPITASAGAASAGLPIAANAQGQIDPSFYGAQMEPVTATETIAPGAFVNLYGSGTGNGTFSVRNADAASNKPAHGFSRAGGASGSPVSVSVSGVNDALSGLSPGRYYLGAAGAPTQTMPSGTGTRLQVLGTAMSATQLDFQPNAGTVLA